MSHRILNAQTRAQLWLHQRASRAAGNEATAPARGRIGMLGAGALGAIAFAPALASANTPATGCTANTAGLTNLIQQAANFLIIIGGAFAVLMFAVGGFMIMGLGGTRKVRKGFDIVKNALIGLAIMIGGIFVREVLVKFIGGATNGKNATDCLKNDPFGNPNAT